jgi:DNA repair exonuclease SbcCD ATPase subunit
MASTVSQKENAIVNRDLNPAFDEWAKKNTGAKAAEFTRAAQLMQKYNITTTTVSRQINLYLFNEAANEILLSKLKNGSITETDGMYYYGTNNKASKAEILEKIKEKYKADIRETLVPKLQTLIRLGFQSAEFKKTKQDKLTEIDTHTRALNGLKQVLKDEEDLLAKKQREYADVLDKQGKFLSQKRQEIEQAKYHSESLANSKRGQALQAQGLLQGLAAQDLQRQQQLQQLQEAKARSDAHLRELENELNRARQAQTSQENEEKRHLENLELQKELAKAARDKLDEQIDATKAGFEDVGKAVTNVSNTMEKGFKAIQDEFAALRKELGKIGEPNVQKIIKAMGKCSAGFDWIDKPAEGGYRCSAGSHFISYAEIANYNRTGRMPPV